MRTAKILGSIRLKVSPDEGSKRPAIGGGRDQTRAIIIQDGNMAKIERLDR